jgi:hypothetical protein
MMLADQINWMNENGGLSFAAGRSAESAAHIYDGAEKTSYTTPFVRSRLYTDIPTIQICHFERIRRRCHRFYLQTYGICYQFLNVNLNEI